MGMVDRLGVYTSLAGVVENAASLSDGKYSGAFLAPCFVAIMLVAGCLANCIGRMVVEYAMAPILERCGVINHKHAVKPTSSAPRWPR